MLLSAMSTLATSLSAVTFQVASFILRLVPFSEKLVSLKLKPATVEAASKIAPVSVERPACLPVALLFWPAALPSPRERCTSLPLLV